MSTFGSTLFSGSRFVRWSLTPVLVVFAVYFPFTLKEWDISKIIILLGLELIALTLLAGFWLPRRLGIVAFRLLCGIIFLAYAAYLFSECRLWLLGERTFSDNPRTASTPLNAFLGLVVIGLPALRYAWRGRFNSGEAISPEKLAELRAERERYIRQPDWEFLESHLARQVPSALKELYEDLNLVLSEDLDYSEICSICFFESISHDGIWKDSRLGYDPFVFAMSNFGDPIYLKPGPDETDAVYITYHDGGDTETLASSMEDFLIRLRAANPLTPPSTPPAA